MSIKELKQKSRQQLGNQIFANAWLLTLVAFLIYSVVTSISAVVVIGPILVAGPLEFGISRFMIRNIRNNELSFENLLKGFTESMGNSIVMGLLEAIFLALWSLLFVVPGIIKSYSYAMSGFILQDNPNMGGNDAITESRKMMNGYKMKLFILDLSFIGWYILGMLCFGIGVLFVIPYHNQARANFYEEIKNK